MAIWSGAIAFGLVSIPIKVTAATGSHDLGLHQYHAADEGRIRYLKVCEIDDEPVDPDEIVKGFETPDDEVVLLDEDDLKDLPVSTSKTIEVLEFVPAEQIDPIYYDKSYYLEPDKTGGRPYVLLREALIQQDRIAVVKVTLRRRESLAALRPRGEALVMHTMMWPDEIRKPQTSGLDAEVRDQELEMAGTLIDAMAADFHPEGYTDAYQEALADLIEAKHEGRSAPKSKRERPKAKVIDLMDALQQSVDQRKRPAKKTARKAAKKTAKKSAKKTARKAPAKKAAKKAAASRRKSA
ncbi:Ku protein [Glycomyces artemisiae]|uniref:Non-homologous end joining protein Ku n=2 Tax=Glycomyces artemisiae TaxID=1076443 RepID=A0A2T0UPH4_9ACTN|nr:Ku protein [Glycomyces artemisiae]PRY59820.1 DNA end-binding protein Ku [Glycomyces artemisiae]